MGKADRATSAQLITANPT